MKDHTRRPESGIVPSVKRVRGTGSEGSASAAPAAGRRSEYGIYVHVPFCARRCDYCDFATWTDRGHLVEAYVDACVADYASRAARGEVRAATTVFIGGGTPSLLPAELVVRLLEVIDIAADAEVSIEANPDSVDATKLAAYVAAGVTRVSLGVQSTQPHVLAALGRTHDHAHVASAVAAVRDAGLTSFNLDLIYGAHGESDDDWCRTLDDVLALDPPHVSAYALTVEPATPLGRRVAGGLVPPTDDDVQARRYEIADDVLEDAARGWYEISNWARPGHECRHNVGYWQGAEVLALGCAAHGYTSGRRWWNVRAPERYIERVRRGDSPVAGTEQLGSNERAEEAFALRLRTSGGVPAPPRSPVVDELVAAGFVTRQDSDLVLTRRGRLLATEVTAQLLLAGAARDQGLALDTIEC